MCDVRENDSKIVALIDLGSNSVRMSIVQIFPNGATSVLNHVKHMVQLGQGAFLNNILQRDAMDRTIVVLRSFAQICETAMVDEVIAVATSAVRDAENGKAFLAEIKEQTNFSFSSISGIEEARLIYKGISNSLEASTMLRFYLDIGGGSSEFIIGDSYKHRELDSVKVGCVRMANIFMQDKHGVISEKEYKQMQSYVSTLANHVIGRMSSYVAKEMIVSSGTVKNLAEIAACLDINDKRLIKDNFLSYKVLCQVVRLLCSRTEEERKKILGINPKRANVIIPGAAILQTVMEELGFDGCYVSSLGVREGLLRDYIEKHFPHVKTQDTADQDSSVFKFAKSCRYEEQHAKHVAFLSLALFDSAKQIGLHTLKEEDRKLLYYSAILHDVGTFVAFSGHDIHGNYLVKNHSLLGFTEKNQEELAYLVGSHRMKVSKQLPSIENLSVDRKEELNTLTLFLKLAEALDRTHNQTIDEAIFKREENNDIYLDMVITAPSPVEQEKIEEGRKLLEGFFPKFKDFRWNCKK